MIDLYEELKESLVLYYIVCITFFSVRPIISQLFGLVEIFEHRAVSLFDLTQVPSRSSNATVVLFY